MVVPTHKATVICPDNTITFHEVSFGSPQENDELVQFPSGWIVIIEAPPPEMYSVYRALVAHHSDGTQISDYFGQIGTGSEIYKALAEAGAY